MKLRQLFQVLAFVLASIVEVHVKAQEVVTLPEAKSPIEVPEKCLVEASVCTVKTKSHQRYTLKMEDTDVVLSANSVFARLTNETGSVIDGLVYINTKKNFKIETPYGSFVSQGGEFLVYHQEKQYLAKVLNGELIIEPRGHDKKLTLAAGFENWIGRVDVSGKASVGIPQPLDYALVTKHLAPIYPGSKNEFAALMRALHISWQDSVAEAALTHEQMVKRELASQAEREKQREAARKKMQEEREFLRSMLFKKTFE